jgi:FkbM family methyltransferase
MLVLKKKIKEYLRKVGYSLYKSSSFVSPSSEQVTKTIINRNDKLIIFDVGAYIGNSAKKYSEWFPQSLIYSFEPFEPNFNELAKLTSQQIKSFNIGLSDEAKFGTLCINAGSSTNSILPLNKNASKLWGGIEDLNPVSKINCEFSTIDIFMEKNLINYIDFLKIDVQGAEFKVLEGAKKNLLSQNIKLIQVEVIVVSTYEGQKTMGFYLDLFESYGYKLKGISDMAHHQGQLLQLDMFFII